MIQYDNAVSRYGKIILYRLRDEGIKCWIAGGAIRDYFSGVPIKTDHDIFFPNQEEYEKALLYFKTNKAEVKWESDNGVKLEFESRVFDLVKKFFQSPKDTIDAFDFTVAMFAVDADNVYSGESSFIDLAKRQLMINKITYPASTLSRAFRYYKKGFVMCKGEMKKLFESIQDVPKVIITDDTVEIDKDDFTSGDMNRFWTGID